MTTQRLYKTEYLDDYEKCVIASKYDAWREGNALLMKIGYLRFKPTCTEYEIGEKFKLDYVRVLCFKLYLNGLMEISIRESVEMVLSDDAAAMTDGTNTFLLP